MINKINPKLCSMMSLILLLSGAVINPASANDNKYYDFPTGEHEGGGVRGQGIGCMALNADNPQPFTPRDIQTLTVSASPELLFYVPDIDRASTLDIVLLDRDDRLVSRQEFNSGDRAGIISMNLIDERSNNGLELDSSYSWSLIQECAGVAEPQVLASGSIKRIKLDKTLASKLEFASLKEKVKLYQTANIWHEEIANLTRLKCNILESNTEQNQWLNVENIDNSSRFITHSLDDYCLNNTFTESIVIN